MRANEHDLNSLRGMIRRLQEENASLKKLLAEGQSSHRVAVDGVDVIDPRAVIE